MMGMALILVMKVHLVVFNAFRREMEGIYCEVVTESKRVTNL